MKPETPLPWTEIPGIDWPGEFESYGSFEISEEDVPYILHACNAYPKLVKELNRLRFSNIFQGNYVKITDLLIELGEL